MARGARLLQEAKERHGAKAREDEVRKEETRKVEAQKEDAEKVQATKEEAVKKQGRSAEASKEAQNVRDRRSKGRARLLEDKEVLSCRTTRS